MNHRTAMQNATASLSRYQNEASKLLKITRNSKAPVEEMTVRKSFESDYIDLGGTLPLDAVKNTKMDYATLANLTAKEMLEDMEISNKLRTLIGKLSAIAKSYTKKIEESKTVLATIERGKLRRNQIQMVREAFIDDCSFTVESVNNFIKPVTISRSLFTMIPAEILERAEKSQNEKNLKEIYCRRCFCDKRQPLPENSYANGQEMLEAMSRHTLKTGIYKNNTMHGSSYSSLKDLPNLPVNLKRKVITEVIDYVAANKLGYGDVDDLIIKEVIAMSDNNEALCRSLGVGTMNTMSVDYSTCRFYVNNSILPRNLMTGVIKHQRVLAEYNKHISNRLRSQRSLMSNLNTGHGWGAVLS